MSYALWNKKRLFTEAEYSVADPLERIYMHLLQPDELKLNMYDELRLKNLKIAFAIACEEGSHFTRIKKVSEALDVNSRNAQKWIADSLLLFADILKVNKDLEKAVIREKLVKLAEKANERGDYETELKAWQTVTKLFGLDKPEPDSKPKKAKFAQVIFTNNPNALKIDAEDAEYEETNDLLE
jgi:hypothetical protein